MTSERAVLDLLSSGRWLWLMIVPSVVELAYWLYPVKQPVDWFAFTLWTLAPGIVVLVARSARR